jgi:CHAD domain-containing protein
MSYRLENGEKVANGMRRIVLEQADKALEQLTAKSGNKDDAIHNARVCFKKIRAVLRLMADRMGGDFQKENICYRDLGRRLSSVRNNVAMIESLAKLKERFGDQLSEKALSKPRRPLVESDARDKADKSRALAEVARGLRSARGRVEKWPLGNDGFGDLAGGLKRTYKQGRQGFAASCEGPTVANLHEWRKRVKDLWYQVRVLKKIWPGEVGKLADELEKLGDYLSDHHDLALLRASAGENWKEIGDESEIETLIALIDQRAAELRLEARLLGERIYAEKPSAFVNRLQHYWHAWRAESKVQPVAAHARKLE